MDLVHKILTMALDSLVACPELVRPRLAERDGVAPGVLDLGCGSGVWSVTVIDLHSLFFLEG